MTDTFIIKSNNWFLYILECGDKSYYIGISNNVDKRIEKHNLKKGSKYVRSRLPATLVYQEGPFTKSDALKKEIFYKKFSKKQKKDIINGCK